MIDPPIRELLTKVDNRYTLVVAVAKRARQLVDGQPQLVSNVHSHNPVTIAAHEIAQGKVVYERTK